MKRLMTLAAAVTALSAPLFSPVMSTATAQDREPAQATEQEMERGGGAYAQGERLREMREGRKHEENEEEHEHGTRVVLRRAGALIVVACSPKEPTRECFTESLRFIERIHALHQREPDRDRERDGGRAR
jgi:hypothetical protein